MDASALMPEQGFSGRLVRHDDTETRLSDWQEEYGPKANHQSYQDICDMYPNNKWCRLNPRLAKRRKKRKLVHSAMPPGVSESSDGAAAAPAPAPKEWHEHVADVGDGVADAAQDAHNTVKDWLGMGGSSEKETKSEEGEEDGTAAAAADAHEQATESVEDAHGAVKDWLGAGDSEDSEDAPPAPAPAPGEGAAAEGGTVADDAHGAVKDWLGAGESPAPSGDSGGDSEDSEDAAAADHSASEGEGAAAEGEAAPEGEAAAEGGAADEGAAAAAGSAGAEGESQPAEAPITEKIEDTTTGIPLYDAPETKEKETWWWPFSWP